jgi:Tol biopolymer transport system component
MSRLIWPPHWTRPRANHKLATITLRFSTTLLLFLMFCNGTNTLVGVIAVAGAFPGSRARGSAVALPRVASVTQVTHDGFSKTNLLSDDSHLYVTEWPAAHHVIAKVSLQGSDRSVIPSPFSNLQALDLSPDRAQLLVSPIQGGSSDNEFWTLPIATGSPERVGNLTGRDATWSVDGQHLAFGKGSVLYLASATGTQVHELFTANGSVFAPRFSPDGQRIRFTVGDAAQNTTSLWNIDRDGSNPHALLANWQNGSTACCGSWTADGRYYIFQVTESAPTTITTLWALPDFGRGADEGTPGLIQLTSGPMSFGNASPARDNKKIWAIGVQPAGEVVKYDPDKKKFVPLVSGASATDLDFSSDGKWVTYVAIPEGTLWRCRADGIDRLQLTSAPERAALPHWSPDGKHIAYVSMQPGKPWKISVTPAGGGTSQEILAESRSQVDANWSSDGTRIMFGYLHDAEGINIRIVNLKTHKTVTVPGSDGLFSPRWSPDGRSIAALSPDFTAVMLFDFESQKWSNWLTEPAGAVSYPVWAADSKYLYYDDLVTDEESIRRVKVGESHAERVFALEGIERYPGAFGLWTGRAADGSWMFVRDLSTQEVYRLNVELP